MNVEPDRTFRIPKSSVKRKNGFSLDFGGSAIKVVCAHEETDHVRLDFLTFSHENAPNALIYIKSKLAQHIDQESQVYTTGITVSHFQGHIKEHLGVSIENILEMDAFAKGLLFLTKHFPLQDLVHIDSPSVQQYAVQASAQFMEAVKTWSKDLGSAVPQELPDMANLPAPGPDQAVLQFPLMVVSCGSAAGAMQINENRKLELIGMTTCCGRFFMGMGSLLTGAKTYQELVAMAERGDAGKLDILSNQLAIGDEDRYSKFFSTGTPLFAFGHAVGKRLDDFNKEDIAAALLSHVAQQLATAVHAWAVTERIPQVFFCGGFTSHSQYVRDAVAKHVAQLSLMNKQGFHSQHYFLKLGAYVACLGSLLATLQE